MAHNQVKKMGDEWLTETIEKLQEEIAIEKNLNSTTLDMSEENIIANEILLAKYAFLYQEARHRHTRFSGFTNAISE
ncbi:MULTISPECIES: YaaL family protein [Lactobacillus]|uniref:YaaL family protein n=1 Tax=Lactobacillus panisapium TaxID=2012495 RepID=A0ABX8W7K3_9LACO|nr:MULTISPECIES: YaaL family protein [Lactobacillus]MCO6532476.1 YaaL family protein [Lactobacillus sp.]MCO6534223.1 YaaL family protein [Lactobacillus sp.]MCO6536228.1 YaaL family protein [Lactobacillus sp.]MCT6854068.1 YaaL family protein [Lactobacillus panisapium]MCT6865898.1 YaaL family protein [Lactobacillus panisapium]